MVAQSVPSGEHAECMAKARAMLRAVAAAERGFGGGNDPGLPPNK